MNSKRKWLQQQEGTLSWWGMGLRFTHTGHSKSGHTDRWDLYRTADSRPLGTIKYGQGGYCLYPTDKVRLSSDELDQTAGFIEKINFEARSQWSKDERARRKENEIRE